jgi:hypothetical protein
MYQHPSNLNTFHIGYSYWHMNAACTNDYCKFCLEGLCQGLDGTDGSDGTCFCEEKENFSKCSVMFLAL